MKALKNDFKKNSPKNVLRSLISHLYLNFYFLLKQLWTTNKGIDQNHICLNTKITILLKYHFQQKMDNSVTKI